MNQQESPGLPGFQADQRLAGRGRKEHLTNDRVSTRSAPRKPMSDADWLKVHHHLADVCVPTGSVGNTVRGGDAARVLCNAMARAAYKGFGKREGSASELVRVLQSIDALSPRHTFKRAAPAAFKLLSTLTPLVEVVGAGRFRLHLESPRYWPRALKLAVGVSP